MQGDPANLRSRVFDVATRLPPLASWMLAWIVAAHLHGTDAVLLPDIAAGLTFVLVLQHGLPGLAAVLAGWSICLFGDATIGLLADPLQAAVHIAGYGAFGWLARHNGCGDRPEQVRALLVLWGVAAMAAALVATSAALLRTLEQPGDYFLRVAGGSWLPGFTGIVVMLAPFWPLPARRAGGGWLAAVLLAVAAAVGAALVPWPLDETSRLALFTVAAALGAGCAALGAGLGGVAVSGLLQALAVVWLALQAVPMVGPAWLAMLALVQVAATVVAVMQESRWRLAQQQQTFERDTAQLQRLALFDLVADHSPDVISVHNADFDFCYASPYIHRLLGLGPDERPGALADLLPRIHPADRPPVLPAELPPGGRWRFRLRGGDHRWHWLESLYTQVGEGEARRYVVITRDIGAHIEQTETLHAMALHDPLTQLYNRRAANSMGERLWEEAMTQRMPFAVVLLDIDHFKRINDTYGHDVGDEVIKQVAAILPVFTRQRDLVCRWGGEEFLMLLPESDAEGALQIAERVRGEVASTAVVVNNQRLVIHISAGVAERSDGDAELATVIERADQGLYAAKEQGRNRVVPMRKTG